MATKTITIPDNKVADILNAFAYNHSIPNIPHPNNPGQLIPRFTKVEWVDVVLKNFIVKEVSRYKTSLARRNATVAEDDTLLTIT